MSTPAVPVLSLRSITKRFGAVVANDGVSLDAYGGEIHTLLGENGAGKSTLMSILSGRYRPDAGTIQVRGKDVAFSSPAEALDAGIGMVYQRFMLVEPLTVAENIVLGCRGTGFSLGLKDAAREIRELAARFGFDLDPDRRIFELSMGERQRVEILRLLRCKADVLIFDEPTSILTPPEVETFMNILRSLRAEGRAIIFITHKLDEAMELADRISVMRRGRLIAALKPSEVPGKRNLARLMVGREVIFQIDRGEADIGEPVLAAKGLAGPDSRGREAFSSIDLTIRKGEIVALTGVAGNGQTELVAALAGLGPLSGGVVAYHGREYRAGEWRSAKREGLAYVPEDRHAVGSVPDLSLVENFMLTDAARYTRHGLLDMGLARHRTASAVERFSIRCPGLDAPARQLSGGNLQKLILARELARRPDLIIAQQPTQGLDIGATEDVWKALLDARSHAGVLLASTDLREALTLADRVAVMFRGRILDILDVSDEEQLERISPLMAGVVEK